MDATVVELHTVLDELGITSDLVRDEAVGFHLLLSGSVAVDVKETSRPTLTQLRGWADQDQGLLDSFGQERIVMVVADRISPAVREELTAASCGWLDRSGHIRLVVGGYHIDHDIPSLLGPDPRPRNPLQRESGLSVAIDLLARPEGGDPLSVRQVAASTRLSVGSVHQALSDLRHLGLTGDDGRPRDTLFWAVTQVWSVRWFPIVRLERPTASSPRDRLLRFGFEDLNDVGWARTDDGAAASYGAPVATESSLRFFLPDRRALTWTLRTFTQASDEDSAAAFVAVPPTASAVQRRRPGNPWPLAQPLIVAIGLAASGPRGRETLQQWPDPPVGVPRDW